MGKRIVHVEFPAAAGDRGQSFWSELAGWSFSDSGMPRIDYRLFDGGGGGPWGGAVWTSDRPGSGPIVYLDSEAIDADVTRVRELGGGAEDKQPIPHIGWFARCRDTEGNPFSLFQSDENAA
jgi:predicted enzyme related to lactoylglutathione lyase